MPVRSDVLSGLVLGSRHYNICRPFRGAGNYNTTPVEVDLRRIKACGGQRRYRIIHYDPEKRALGEAEFRMTRSGEAQYVG